MAVVKMPSYAQTVVIVHPELGPVTAFYTWTQQYGPSFIWSVTGKSPEEPDVHMDVRALLEYDPTGTKPWSWRTTKEQVDEQRAVVELAHAAHTTPKRSFSLFG